MKDLNYLEKGRKCPQLKQQRIEVPETVSSFTDSKKMSTIRTEYIKLQIITQEKIGTAAGVIVHSQKHVK